MELPGLTTVEIASLVMSAVAIVVAFAASAKGNRIASASVRIERDARILDWSQEVLRCFSSTTALLYNAGDHDEDRFGAERKRLRSDLFALRDQGTIFFSGSYEDAKNDPSIRPLENVVYIITGKGCTRASAIENPRVYVDKIQSERHAFIASIQKRISAEWTAQRL